MLSSTTPFRLVINGYFRTGTTIVARVLKLSNPNVYVLHEPTSVILCNELKSWQQGKPHSLHGFDVYEDYFALGQEFIDGLCKVWRPYSIIREPEVVLQILDYIFNFGCEKKIQLILKLNQAFLCISAIAYRYNTYVLHIYRDPAETLFDQIYPEHQDDLHKVKQALLLGDSNYESIIGFWLDPLYEDLKDLLPVKEVARSGKVYRFLITYITLNTIAIQQCKQCERCFVVRIEEIVEKPQLFKKLIENYTGLKVSDEALRLLSRSKIYKAPEFLRKAVQEAIQTIALRQPEVPSLEEYVK